MPQPPLPSVTDYSAPNTVTVSATVQTHVCRNFSRCPNHFYSYSAATRPCQTQSRHTSLQCTSHLWREQLVQSILRNLPVERTICTEHPTESTCGENNLYRASYGIYLWREQFVQSILRNLPVERTICTEHPTESTCGENNLYRASYGIYLWREQFVQSILRNLPVERTICTEHPTESTCGENSQCRVT